MRKEIIVNAGRLESRVAIMEEGELAELYVEREPKVAGNIYKGRITNVVSGMDAAFAEIGLERHGFLCVDDIIMRREEQEVLGPVVCDLRAQGLSVEGPLAGDTVFALAVQGRFDAVVALYHDQGLAPLKALCFAEGVNVTLGLPIIRTSPDHGVAYDIAGSGVADPTSLKQAIQMAVGMAGTREGA